MSKPLSIQVLKLLGDIASVVFFQDCFMDVVTLQLELQLGHVMVIQKNQPQSFCSFHIALPMLFLKELPIVIYPQILKKQANSFQMEWTNPYQSFPIFPYKEYELNNNSINFFLVQGIYERYDLVVMPALLGQLKNNNHLSIPVLYHLDWFYQHKVYYLQFYH